MKLWDYQDRAVDWITEQRRVLLADDVGLGKSVTALASIARDRALPALIVCPAYLRPNWRRNILSRWVPELFANGTRVREIDRPEDLNDPEPDTIYLTNYESLVRYEETVKKETLTAFDLAMKPKRPFLSPLAERLKTIGLKSIVIDESSYVKSGKAKRTKACKSIARTCGLRLLLSATPIENSPKELISQLDILGKLEDLGGSWYFLARYCDAKKTDWGYWDFSGASHLDELRTLLKRSCLLRRTKAEVQQYLPAKRRETVILPLERPETYQEAEQDVIRWIEAHDGLEAADRAIRAEALVRMSVLRQLAAREKLEAGLAWVKSMLDAGEKVVIFVYHRKIAEATVRRLTELKVTGVLALTGETPSNERDRIVQNFQNSPLVQALVVSIKAGGMGIDLTAASHCVFLELGWTPTDMDQAEGRLHRHGQSRPVASWCLLAQGTVEEEIYALVNAKRAAVEGVLGRPSTQVETTILSEALTPESVAVEAAKLLMKRRIVQ